MKTDARARTRTHTHIFILLYIDLPWEVRWLLTVLRPWSHKANSTMLLYWPHIICCVSYRHILSIFILWQMVCYSYLYYDIWYAAVCSIYSQMTEISGPTLTSVVEATLPMTSSQTDLSSSFYDKMEKLGSMGSRIFSNISGKS